MSTPNWRNPAEYPPANSTTSAQWAWEFLRRNAAYRSDWAMLSKRREEIRTKYGEISRLSEALRPEETEFALLKDDPLGIAYDPEKWADESEAQWLERVGKGRRSSLTVHFENRWGMRGDLVDPDYPWHPYWINSPSIVREVVQSSSADQRTPSRDPHRRIELNVLRPLKPQLSTIKRYAEGQQRALAKEGFTSHGDKRRRPGLKYQRYVRLLDALTALGESDTAHPTTTTIGEIGGALFPRESSVDTRVRAMIPVARQLRDTGYADLSGLA
jgi:hypothetical protein